MNMLISQPGALLQRVADSLEVDVVPALPASYQRTEVEATVLLLRNLAGRVAWRESDLEEELGAAEALVTALAGQQPDEDGDRDFDALARRRLRLGAFIDEVYADAGAPGTADRLAALTTALRESVDREERRNRAGAELVEDGA